MAASPKRLELLPYTVARPDAAAGRAATRSSIGVGRRRRVRPGHEVRADAGPDAHRRPSIRISARSKPIPRSSTCRRSKRSSTSGGRSSSRGPATSTSMPTATTACNGLFYSRRIGRSPHGTARCRAATAIYTDAPAQTTILGAAKLTGRVGKLFDRRRARGDAGGVADVFAPDRSAVRRASWSNRRRTTRWRASGASSRTSRRGRHCHDRQPRRERSGCRCPSTRSPAARTSTGGCPAATASPASSRQPRQRNAGARSTIIQKDSRHFFQRPDLVNSSLDVTRTSLGGTRPRSPSARSAARRALEFVLLLKSPGLRHQRPRIPAARRPAGWATGCSCATTGRPAGSAAVRSTSTSTPPGTTTAIGCSAASTSTAT